jgi:beta-lactamase regulating signal transducer with metallopeptidase domain
MSELVFPFSAVVAVFFVLIRMLTVIAKLALTWRRRRPRPWARFGSAGTFAWLVAPTVLPVAWLLSSAFHQNEAGASACAVAHTHESECLDALLLLTVLLVGLGVGVGLRAWRSRPRLSVQLLDSADPRSLRLAALAGADTHLRRLPVGVANHTAQPVFTIGWLRPRAIVDACFLESADDAMLRASLLHEQAHAANLDSLRCFVVRLCLAINPLRAWLAPEFARWRGAREADCDGQAVHRGGEALALAEGIVRAARFRCRDGLPTVSAGVSALCGHDAAALKLRVALLMEGPEAPRRSWGHLSLALAVLAATAAPHLPGVGILERFHSAIERSFSWIG